MTDPAIHPDEVIRDAYRVVAHPELLFDLHMRLELAQEGSSEALNALNQHVGQIDELIEKLHFGPDADFSRMGVGGKNNSDNPVDHLDPAPREVLSLNRSFRIVSIHPTLCQDETLSVGEFLPDWLLGEDKNARSRTKALIKDGSVGAVGYCRLLIGDEDGRGVMTQVRLVERGGDNLAVFAPLLLDWSEATGALFASVMGLSETEKGLTRFIVEGRSLNDFADQRGRSVGTARNQMKTIFRKLGIGSQTELVSLYAGFSVSVDLTGYEAGGDKANTGGNSVTFKDGTSLRFERYGKEGGKPVILLHGAIEGPFLTPDLQRCAMAEGLELFVPWMPFYAEAEAALDARQKIEEFAGRLDEFASALGLGKCALLSCSISGPYALAAMKRWPDRFLGVVACGFAPPFDRLDQLGQMNPLWRAPLIIGRRAPGMVDLFVRSLVRLAMRGEAYRYFDRLLKDSPLDRQTLARPDVESVVRKSFANRPDKAGRALAHALLVQALDWGEWLEGHTRPVRIISGEQDVIHTPDELATFAQHCGFELVGPLPDCGGFSLFQRPARIFSELSALHE